MTRIIQEMMTHADYLDANI